MIWENKGRSKDYISYPINISIFRGNLTTNLFKVRTLFPEYTRRKCQNKVQKIQF